MHIAILFQMIFPIRFFQSIAYTPLYYTGSLFGLSILHRIVCIWYLKLPILLLPYPSPLATTSVFSMSVSLFLCCKYGPSGRVLGSPYKWNHMVFVFLSDWVPLAWLSLRPMYVAANGMISFFLWLSNITWNICTTPFFSYSPGSDGFHLFFFFHFYFSIENYKAHFSLIGVVFWSCLSWESLKISLWENHLLNGNIIQMHVSDNVVGKPL